MQEHSLFKIFIDKLNKLNAPYFITGSVASIIYGEPRLTHDIDIIITMSSGLLERMVKSFPVDEFYIPPIEILNNEARRESRGHCNIIHHSSGFKADIYFAGSDEFQKWALDNCKVIEFYGDKIPIAPVEYVIIKKLEFYREGRAEKHLRDIKAILENSKDLIKYDILDKYLAKFGLEKEWHLC